MVTYSEDGKYAYFDGKSFCRDEKTGYFLNTGIHKRLHRYVYEKTVGPIPKGYDIHHKDHDKNNNEPENLELLTRSEHLKRHAAEMTEEQRNKLRENIITRGVPAAVLWHKSAAGYEWHKAHYESHKEALHRTATYKCEYCGKEYTAQTNGHNRFCSNNCKSAWRRKAGLDNVERACEVCGTIFTINKYAPKRYCCRKCEARGRAENSKNKKAAAAACI